MDLSAFYQTFFDEADELLADMEQHLLQLDPQVPDSEQLNAIFRAAYSIKGGAGTFGFSALQETTHLLENLLDEVSRGEMSLNTDSVDLFLKTKDIMQDQLDAYKMAQQLDEESYRYICEALRELALTAKGGDGVASAGACRAKAAADEPVHEIVLTGLTQQEIALMREELANLGDVLADSESENGLSVRLQSTLGEEDIVAVLCFVLEPEQIRFAHAGAPIQTGQCADEQNVDDRPAPACTPGDAAASPAPADVSTAGQASVGEADSAQDLAGAQAAMAADIGAVADVATDAQDVAPAGRQSSTSVPAAAPKMAVKSTDGSIRVAVEKVDQLINLVGELVITQSMLAQRSSELDPAHYSELLNSMGQLERNARDLQESVMSIRMMPMEYVFSRFPRLVRDLAAKLGKEVRLEMQGSSTELDKSLIERIIDPLTHLVRNSLDHVLEFPAARLAAGKSAVGTLVLAAEHQGGNICIEVRDDGAGLNRAKILAKASAQGMAVSEHLSDEDVGRLIFAPGFSTAEAVTDVSGRGVGMDVVKRNIQAMGGHVDILFEAGKGTTVRILLPLTLAILDGMSVRISDEAFILPLNTVMESLQPQAQDLYRMGGDELVLQVRGEYLPLVALHHVFNVPGAKTDPTEGIAVILQSAGCRYALLVDQLVGQHQIVVKNLESNYRKVAGISAVTIMGDGSGALIVDVSALQPLNRDKCQASAA
ncbi:chemotaxis protein CheA [Candidatus Sodalis pierantonius str. SOPE]|uniref:Chemotaxis protein CheA n=1 Tax=Candidatus Sodalis pierantonii str. SOPE TaxID=2342 RepID=W0HRX2_9GAMM|nr:chemotaxis protein CheA [Candidatus Sodalis pierantonius]AHF74930.1 chemotaxis protein CheA [Candidatus Sodalis pierantonius str. SOPE]